MTGTGVKRLEAETNLESDARDLVLKGDYVAFIGAGISNPPGQQWRELVEEIGRY